MGKKLDTGTDGYTGLQKMYKTLKNDAVFYILNNEGGTGVRLFVSTDWFTTAQERQFPASGTLFFERRYWLVSRKTTIYWTTDRCSGIKLESSKELWWLSLFYR